MPDLPMSDLPTPNSIMPDLNDEAERILRSRLFDHSYYGGIAPAAGASPMDDVLHYLQTGERSGMQPTPLFDPLWYAARWNTDRPLLDYLAHPTAHDPHPLFSTAFYLEQGPDIPEGQTPLAHYRHEGWRHGLDPHPLFSTRHYLAENADVAGLGYNPLEHFLTNGWPEGRMPCPEFDPGFYRARYPDIARAGINPLSHYATNGAAEGRDPSAGFDAAWYNAQLRGGQHRRPNPLIHYRLHGRRAGWLPKYSEWRLDAAGMLSPADAAAWATNARVQAAAAAPSRVRPVGVVVLGHASPPLPEEGLLLVLQDGDRLHPDASPLVAATSGLLTTFDALATDADGAVLPVLLPGANVLALLATPTLPVFCADAALMRRHGLPPATADHAAMLAWFRALVSDAAAADGLRHMPVPIAEVPLHRFRPPGPALLPELERIAGAVHHPADAPPGDVSVVICTKDAGHLLAQLVVSLVQAPAARLRDVVLVLNRPVNAFARAHHARLRALPRVVIVDYDKPYNFSDQVNVGARAAGGAFLLLLNDDIVPIGMHWLSHLLAPMARPEVAIAGPLLLYPDETVQHAGMFMGFNNVAGHHLRGAKLPDTGTAAGLVPQNVAAVTGAVMLIRRSAWDALAGFDTQLASFIQDVDLCLRARRMGMEIAFTPDAMLFHMESISARPTLADPATQDRRGREYARFVKRWGREIHQDPFRSPHLSKQDETARTLVSISQPDFQDAHRG